MTPTYIVRPHPSGDGVQVSGPGFRHAIWLEDECDAAKQARRIAEALRFERSRVWFVGRDGRVWLSETITRGDAYAGG